MQVIIPAGESGVTISDLAPGNYLISISAPGFVTATGTLSLAAGETLGYGYSLGAKDPRDSYDNYVLAYFHAISSILLFLGYTGIQTDVPVLFIEQVVDVYERLVDGETVGEATAHEMIDIVNEGWEYIAPHTAPFTDALEDFVDTVVEEGTEAVLDQLLGGDPIFGDDDEEGGSSKIFLILGLAAVVIIALEVL